MQKLVDFYYQEKIWKKHVFNLKFSTLYKLKDKNLL